jgi:hypothetical protein
VGNQIMTEGGVAVCELVRTSKEFFQPRRRDSARRLSVAGDDPLECVLIAQAMWLPRRKPAIE